MSQSDDLRRKQRERIGHFFGTYVAFYFLSAVVTAPIALLTTPAINIAFNTDYGLLEGFIMVWASFLTLCVASLFWDLLCRLGKD